ncbi:MAG: NAD-dependent deacylase [Acidobacteria bacterium]|nr:NAD-dependent deacylase [Acidobacteriota bacterium]
MEPALSVPLNQVATWLREAASVVATTGAGISAESGVPTFRGADGLWRTFSAADLATPGAFARQPGLVWEWYRWRRAIISRAQPNEGHRVLARWATSLRRFSLVTQNVDGLHQRAGSPEVLELHGNIWRTRCAAGCGHVVDDSRSEAGIAATDEDQQVPVCRCGARMRPDVVWFGEALDPAVVNRAMALAERCDVLLVIGTSALVYPAAALPDVASRHGARVVEVNVDETPLSPFADAVLRGPSGTVLRELESLL